MRPTLSTSLTAHAHGSAPTAEVWAALVTPSRWPSWSPQIRAVRCERPDEPLRLGLHGTVLGPGGVALPFEVTEVDDLRRRWSWRVRVGGVVVHAEHGVDGDGGASRAWTRVTGPAPLVLAYLPLARLALGRLVDSRVGAAGAGGRPS